MRSLLKFATTFVFLANVIAQDGELEKRDNTTLKAPVVAVPSQHWYVTKPHILLQILIVVKGGRRWHLVNIRNSRWNTRTNDSSIASDIMAGDLGGVGSSCRCVQYQLGSSIRLFGFERDSFRIVELLNVAK